MDEAKIMDAVKRYSYLLGQTELFKHFVDIEAAMMDAQPKPSDHRRRHHKSEMRNRLRTGKWQETGPLCSRNHRPS